MLFDLDTRPARVMPGRLPVSVSTREELEAAVIMDVMQVILTVLEGTAVSEGAVAAIRFILRDDAVPLPHVEFANDVMVSDLQFLEADNDGAQPAVSVSPTFDIRRRSCWYK